MAAMRLLPTIFLSAILLVGTKSIEAGGAKIIKTLPHYLDEQGRHTIHPSLFERDAYQQELKSHPERCSGMRFDVQWKGKGIANQMVKVRLEVRGEKTPPRTMETFNQDVKGRRLSQWSSLRVSGEDFKRTGNILAWRVSVWQGATLLAEQKSFLW
jgi:hypothetical protein